jgi:hypothetical protein
MTKAGASPTTWVVLEELWRDMPDLKVLQELQLREVQGLDWRTCSRFATNALGAPCLRSVDLR